MMKRLLPALILLLACGVARAQPGPVMPSAPFIATNSTTARTPANRAADTINLLDYGGDATGVSDNLAALNRAADTVASGATVRIYVPRGTYNMSAAFTGDGRNVTLQVDPGTTWTGFNPAYYGPRVETVTNFARQTNIVLNDTSSTTTAGDSWNIEERGVQGPPVWFRTYTYDGNGATGGWQSVPVNDVCRWDSLTLPTSFGVACYNNLTLFPLTGSGSGAVGEWNPVNRTGDPGWSGLFAGLNHYGGLAIIPNADTVTGGTHYGYHTEYGFGIQKGQGANNLGYEPATYNGFIVYPLGVAPGGLDFGAYGSASQMPNNPFATSNGTSTITVTLSDAADMYGAVNGDSVYIPSSYTISGVTFGAASYTIAGVNTSAGTFTITGTGSAGSSTTGGGGGQTVDLKRNGPYSPLRIGGYFTNGIYVEQSALFNDGLAVHSIPGAGMGWDDGTGVASVTGTKVSAGHISVDLNPTTNDPINAGGPLRLKAYTVGTLPTCNSAMKGAMAYVTDAAASPVYNATAANGGSVIIPEFCNGTNWTNH